MFIDPITSDPVLDQLQHLGGDITSIEEAHRIARAIPGFNQAASEQTQKSGKDRSAFVIDKQTYRYGYASLHRWYLSKQGG